MCDTPSLPNSTKKAFKIRDHDFGVQFCCSVHVLPLLLMSFCKSSWDSHEKTEEILMSFCYNLMRISWDCFFHVTYGTYSHEIWPVSWEFLQASHENSFHVNLTTVKLMSFSCNLESHQTLMSLSRSRAKPRVKRKRDGFENCYQWPRMSELEHRQPRKCRLVSIISWFIFTKLVACEHL